MNHSHPQLIHKVSFHSKNQFETLWRNFGKSTCDPQKTQYTKGLLLKGHGSVKCTCPWKHRVYILFLFLFFLFLFTKDIILTLWHTLFTDRDQVKCHFLHSQLHTSTIFRAAFNFWDKALHTNAATSHPVWFSTSATPRFHSDCHILPPYSQQREIPCVTVIALSLLSHSAACLHHLLPVCVFMKTSGDIAHTGLLTYSVVLLRDLVQMSYLVSLSWFREVFSIAEEATFLDLVESVDDTSTVDRRAISIGCSVC